MIFKKVKTASRSGKEKIMYFRDGKLISEKNVPQEVVDSEKFGEVISVEDEQPIPKPILLEEPPQEKTCLFCGAFGKYPKFVHMQTVYICEEHKDNTVGSIGAKIKEIYNV